MSEQTVRYRAYVERHRRFVLEEATKLDIVQRGLQHDLSKYEPDEFDAYAAYFYGGYEKGQAPPMVQDAFDKVWLLHQKRNDHHWQWWVLREDSGATKVLQMSDDAQREMLADWRGAGRAILGESSDTKAWYEKNGEKILLHPRTRRWIEEHL